MTRTEEQIIAIAKNVMQAVKWDYDKNKPIIAVFTSKEELYEKWKNLEGFDQYKGRIKSFWQVSFDFPPEDEIYHNTIFLEIDDETGEPTELRHRQAVFQFHKKGTGWELKQTYQM